MPQMIPLKIVWLRYEYFGLTVMQPESYVVKMVLPTAFRVICVIVEK